MNKEKKQDFRYEKPVLEILDIGVSGVSTCGGGSAALVTCGPNGGAAQVTCSGGGADL